MAFLKLFGNALFGQRASAGLKRRTSLWLLLAVSVGFCAMAPMPLRGKVNTPANVPLVAAKLAEIKGIAVEEIAEATARNFERLFLRTVPRSSDAG
jgi:hypothetical protein